MQRALPAFIAACLFAVSLQAHETYLLPDKGIAASPAAVLLTSGMKFPQPHYGIKKARIAKTVVEGPDAKATLKATTEGAKTLTLMLKAAKPGTYVTGVELSPHDIDLKPEQVAEYFTEIDAPPALRADYDALPEPKAWRETYTKYAKTAFCIIACTGADVLTHALGAKLEFVALAGTGGQPRFQLLRNGAPLKGAAVAVFRNDGARMFQPTDDNGAVTLPRGLSGTVMLAAVIVAPPKAKGGRFTSDFATLTFDTALFASH